MLLTHIFFVKDSDPNGMVLTVKRERHVLKEYLRKHSIFLPLSQTLRFVYYLFTHRKVLGKVVFARNRKRLSTIAKEVCQIWFYWKVFPFHYFRYGLYSKSYNLKKEELLDFVPEFYFDWVLVPSLNDSESFEDVMKNKILQERYLKSCGIRVPETAFYFISGGLYNGNFEPVDSLSLPSNFPKEGTLFVKPVNGKGGDGITILREFNVTYEAIIEAVCCEKDYICQVGIKQHWILSKLYPTSVNTIRVVASRTRGSSFEVAFILRVGQNGSMVDNSHQGGISIEIDKESWTLKRTGYSEHPLRSYSRHPDTGVVFEGFSLPFMRETKSIVSKAISLFPFCGLLGLDVALSERGPLIVEVNDGFGIDHVQISLQRGIRKLINRSDE